MNSNLNRREVLAAWTAALVTSGLTTQAVASEVTDVIAMSDLDKRLKALAACDWQWFKAEEISLTGDQISIWDICIAFYDEKEKATWYKVSSVLRSADVNAIFSIIWWNNQQKHFFFTQVLWMESDDYWLDNVWSWWESQAILSLKNNSTQLQNLWDGWGSRNDQLLQRKKIT